MAAKPVFFGTIKNAAVQIVNADGVTLKTLYTAPTNGGKVEAIAISSSDTVARDIQLVVTKGAVDYVIGTISIPITAGQVAATPAIDGLQASASPWVRSDENGNPFLLLENGSVLKVKTLVTVTTALALQFFAQVREV